VLWAFRSLDGITWLSVEFLAYVTVVFALVWIIQITIPANPMTSVGNAFMCTMLSSFGWMMVDSFDSADIHIMTFSSTQDL
jgi:hypothetical protein